MEVSYRLECGKQVRVLTAETVFDPEPLGESRYVLPSPLSFPNLFAMFLILYCFRVNREKIYKDSCLFPSAWHSVSKCKRVYLGPRNTVL